MMSLKIASLRGMLSVLQQFTLQMYETLVKLVCVYIQILQKQGKS